MSKMKEQMKTLEKELNKMEISNLSDAEFKTLFIGMLKELSKDLGSIKKIQSEKKNTLIEIKNFQGKNSKVGEVKNQISDLKHKEAKNNQSEQEENRIQKNEDIINSLWDKFKRSHIHIIGVPEE